MSIAGPDRLYFDLRIKFMNTRGGNYPRLLREPNQAYKEHRNERNASSTAFYSKLNRIETPVSTANVLDKRRRRY